MYWWAPSIGLHGIFHHAYVNTILSKAVAASLGRCHVGTHCVLVCHISCAEVTNEDSTSCTKCSRSVHACSWQGLVLVETCLAQWVFYNIFSCTWWVNQNCRSGVYPQVWTKIVGLFSEFQRWACSYIHTEYSQLSDVHIPVCYWVWEWDTTQRASEVM